MKKNDRVRNINDPSKGLGTIREVSTDRRTADVLWDKHRIPNSPDDSLIHQIGVPPSKYFTSELELVTE